MKGTKFSWARERPFGADNASRNAIFKPEGRADRDHPFANLQFIRIALSHLWQTAGLDLEERNIGFPVRADQLGAEFALIGQLYIDFIGCIHQVGIGQNVAVGTDNEARTQRFRFEIPWRAMRLACDGEKIRRMDRPPEYSASQAWPGCPSARSLYRADIYDRRALFFHQFGKIGQLRGGSGRIMPIAP